jgi:hypothetical protein
MLALGALSLGCWVDCGWEEAYLQFSGIPQGRGAGSDMIEAVKAGDT